MSWSLFAGLFVFSAVSAFTPGPNNLMALASGANRGFVKTLPHVAGVAVGFPVMIALIGAGLGGLFALYPKLYLILRYVAFAYLVHLAWHIARSESVGDGGTAREISLLGSAAFQWVNPKAWIAAVTVVSSFTDPARYPQSIAIAALTNVALAVMAVSLWALFGKVVKTWLSNPLRLRAFNWSMAALLVASVLPSLFHG